MLDDDAVIDTNNLYFFNKAIEIMDSHSDIITLTTQIYDAAWKENRIRDSNVRYADGLYKIKMFCGGSHFLRKSFFDNTPYLSNKYGYEEIPPSLKIFDAGKLNVFTPDLRIIHKPAVDKWDHCAVRNHSLLINECAMIYALKKMMYPRIVVPILWLAYRVRCRKYLSRIPRGKTQADAIVKDILEQYFINYRIRGKTLRLMWRDFGASIF